MSSASSQWFLLFVTAEITKPFSGTVFSFVKGVLRYNQVTSQTSWTDWASHFSLKDIFLHSVIFTASLPVFNSSWLTPRLFQDPPHQLWHVGVKLPRGLQVLHFQFMWTWPKWNIPSHREVVLWSSGCFHRGFFVAGCCGQFCRYLHSPCGVK